MMTALGISAEEVGRMSMHDAQDLFAYWRRVPPPAETIRAAFGPARESESEPTERPAGPVTPEDEGRSAAILAGVLAGAVR